MLTKFLVYRNMWKTVFLCGVISCLVTVGKADSFTFIRNGTWAVYSIGRCDQPEKYAADVDVHKGKLNRTHDGYNLTVDFPYEVTSTEISLSFKIWKYCDGGLKLQQDQFEPSFCNVVNQYAEGNFERALAAANVDPPNCPIPKGTLSINNYLINYYEFPTEAIVGDYQITIELLKQHEFLTCIKAEVGFEPDEEEEEDDGIL